MASKGIKATGTGQVTESPCTLFCISSALTTAGTLTLRNGGASGDVLATIDIATGNGHFPIPWGLLFNQGLHVTFTTAVGGVTFWI